MFPFKFLRKKKEKEVKKVYIPVDLVEKYASEGLSEPQIISRLRSQGFAPEHIDRALRIALKERIRTEAPSPPAIPTEIPPTLAGPMPMGLEAPIPYEPISEVSRHPIGYPPERVVSRREPATSFPEFGTAETRAPFTFEKREELPPPVEEVTIEEIIEGIVADRWRDFEEILIDFEKRDLQLQGQIDDLRKEMKEIEGLLTQREKSFLSKLEDFGGSMENIEGRIGSIEKVFKDFLPDLTQNVKIMSDLVEKMEKGK